MDERNPTTQTTMKFFWLDWHDTTATDAALTQCHVVGIRSPHECVFHAVGTKDCTCVSGQCPLIMSVAPITLQHVAPYIKASSSMRVNDTDDMGHLFGLRVRDVRCGFTSVLKTRSFVFLSTTWTRHETSFPRRSDTRKRTDMSHVDDWWVTTQVMMFRGMTEWRPAQSPSIKRSKFELDVCILEDPYAWNARSSVLIIAKWQSIPLCYRLCRLLFTNALFEFLKLRATTGCNTKV